MAAGHPHRHNPLLPPAPPPTQNIPNFTPPDWCTLPRGAPQLLVWRAAALVETVPLGGRAYSVAGRLPECDIVLDHGSASRHHAVVLHHRSGAVYLLDLGSAHGTFLGNQRLPPREPMLWADGVPCVFGASSRTYVLRLSANGPLVPPRAAGPMDARTAAANAPLTQSTPVVTTTTTTTKQPSSLPRPKVTTTTTTTTPLVTPNPVTITLPEEEDRDLGDEIDEECEANTRRNIHIPVVGDSSGGGGERERARHGKRLVSERRRVTFDTQPPSVRVFEVASPEPISDPEVAAGGAAAAASAPSYRSLSAAGGGAAPASLPKPKCSVSVTKRQRVDESTAAEASSSPGKFAHLVSHGLSNVPRNASATSNVSQRLVALYGDAEPAPPPPPEPPPPPLQGAHDEPPPPPPPAEDDEEDDDATKFARWRAKRDAVKAKLAQQRGEGSVLKLRGKARQLAREAATAAFRQAQDVLQEPSPGALSEASPLPESSDAPSSSSAAVGGATSGRVISIGARLLFERSDGERLLVLHFEHSERNPIYGMEPIPIDSFLDAHTPRPNPPPPAAIADDNASAAATIVVSASNPQSKRILVYAALLPPDGDGTLYALTPHAGLMAHDEHPVALSYDGTERGSNCMLLEAKEGTSECVEPSAETSPFGASNTFRCLAATGEPVAWPCQPAEPPQLRIEAAYQVEEDSGTSGAHARTLLSLTHYTRSLALSLLSAAATASRSPSTSSTR